MDIELRLAKMQAEIDALKRSQSGWRQYVREAAKCRPVFRKAIADGLAGFPRSGSESELPKKVAVFSKQWKGELVGILQRFNGGLEDSGFAVDPSGIEGAANFRGTIGKAAEDCLELMTPVAESAGPSLTSERLFPA